MPIPERYNLGYNIGVGGAVVRDGELLLVRRASRHGRGNWQLPGGFIEPDETIEQAVVREVQEEAGVTAKVEAVLALRSRYDPESGNGVYIILLLRPISGEPTADNHEVDHAGPRVAHRIDRQGGPGQSAPGYCRLPGVKPG